MTVKRWRQLLVVVHVLTSLGWMTLAVAQLSLIWHAVRADDAVTRRAALTMTEFLDDHLLEWTAVSCVFTGLMLAALTSWGFFRFWWVAVKLGLSVGALYLGIFLLSTWLQDGVAASAAGGTGSVVQSLYVGPVLPIAMAFMVWLSIAKPWGRIRPAAPRVREREPHPVWYAVALLTPVADYALGLLLPVLRGAPLLPVLVLTGCLVARARRLGNRPGVAASGTARRSGSCAAAAGGASPQLRSPPPLRRHRSVDQGRIGPS